MKTIFGIAIFLLLFLLGFNIDAQTEHSLLKRPQTSNSNFITLYDSGQLDIIINKNTIRCVMATSKPGEPVSEPPPKFKTKIYIDDGSLIQTVTPIEQIRDLL